MLMYCLFKYVKYIDSLKVELLLLWVWKTGLIFPFCANSIGNIFRNIDLHTDHYYKLKSIKRMHLNRQCARKTGRKGERVRERENERESVCCTVEVRY